jgi:ADP-ribose pyrophosphatase YjhB (NUDIX family)
MKKIIASGAVIVENNKLLVTIDAKDNFYKIPGGTLEEGESLKDCAIRELKEETGFSCELIKKLPTLRLKKKPGTNEIINVELHHYLAKLKNPVVNYDSFNHNEQLVSWLNITDIKSYKYAVAPNIKFLIEKEKIN